MSTARTARFLADTGFLICFGALPGGKRYFGEAFNGSVAASPTIRFELNRLEGDRSTRQQVRNAVLSFTGRNHDVLLDVEFEVGDEGERDRALLYLVQKKLPSDPPAPISESSESRRPGRRKPVQHGGEAEIIAMSLRRGLPLLMNDRDGTRYARHRKIPVEPFAESLRRLVGRFSPHEVLQMWRTVHADHDTGAVVTGIGFFRQPPPSWSNSDPT